VLRRVTLVVALAVLLLPVSVLQAQSCRIGTGSSASLLIPYFEYNPGDPLGVTTLISVTNESNNQTLVRVVYWTDWGVPTIAFDVFLPAFDVQTINVRDTFNGMVPSTGEGADLSAFQFCELEAFRPFHGGGPVFTPVQRQQLRAYHTGVGGPLDANCASENHGDGIVRGYITVDVVDECSGIGVGSVFTPAWGGYFADGGGGAGAIAIAQNRIWGDVLIVDPANGFAQGEQAVGLWADPARFTDDPTFTFYGRFSGYDGRDERVPLPTLFATRFLDGGVFSGGTDLIVWRDTGEANPVPIPCGTHPAWHPLQESFIVSRDESGDPAARVELGRGSSFFALATQKVPVGDLSPPYAFGRLQIALADGPLLTNPRQGWIETVMSAQGLFTVGFEARALNELCDQAP